ncbi:MAG: hypothetical protein QGH68_00135 [SAR324 cluster bacterium]|nr:hypothetical protein [SAR324 cluster bacterium]
MAKKTKPKKSGMLKRQQQKRQKKMLRRRQVMPKRVSQQPGSSQQLEQLLSTLPTLAFEPELADLSLDKTELKTLLDSDSTEVDILMELLTEDFIVDLDQRLARLEEANPEKSIKSVLSKATRHQIANSEKIPNLSNPVLIAIFLKTRASVEGVELDLAGLPAAMEEFDKRNHEFIQELTDKIETSGKEEPVAETEEDLLEDEQQEEHIPAVEESVYKKYVELVPAEKQEQVEEDLDVFLVDFQPPPVAEWDLRLVKRFMNKWFIENANPLEEDLYSMRESLLSLFQFLAEEKLLPDTLLAQAEKYLQSE